MVDELKIIHFNTQGFQNKLLGINDFVKVHKPDILVITEHFQKSANDLEQINGYKIVNSFCRKHNERGGVAIWAKENIPCKPRKDLDRHRKEKEFELVSVSVGRDVVVTGAYRPPSTSIPDFHVHLGRFIDKIHKEPHIKHVLTGDFNIDNSKPNKTRTVLTENDLRFHITKTTHRKGRCIDNFITNFDSAKSRVIKSKISNISDHHPIEIVIDKEATLIAKNKDSHLYKLFKKMFEKKTAELKEEMEKKGVSEMKLPQSVIYNMFSNLFHKRSGYNSESYQVDKSTKSFKRKDAENKNQEPLTFWSKFIAFINPWNTGTKTESNEQLRSFSNPTRTSKHKVSSNETAVTTPSFFSKIVKLISFAIQLFKPEEKNSTESKSIIYNKTTKKNTNKPNKPPKDEDQPMVFGYFSKFFKNV